MKTVVVVERWKHNYEHASLYGVYESIAEAEQDTGLHFEPSKWGTDGTRYRAVYRYRQDSQYSWVMEDSFYATVAVVGRRLWADEHDKEAPADIISDEEEVKA